MANSTTSDLTAANEIRNQIGRKALFMLGAYNIAGSSSENFLSFKIKGSRKVNYIKITLNESDLYDMEFGKMGKKLNKEYAAIGMKIYSDTYKVVAEENGVYSDMLHKLIEKHTGLLTSL